jgi:hypothetical protein
MATQANQHYVLQFYFKYFSHNKKSICVLNRQKGKLIETAPIKGQASKKYFYGDTEIEQALCELEGLFSQALREIISNDTFDDCSYENYLLFVQNIMFQKSRTMSSRKNRKGIHDKLLQLHMECAVNNDETLEEQNRQDFVEMARTLESDPKQTQAIEMSVAIENAGELMDLCPVILQNKTNRPFIFSDAPVVFVNPHLKNITLNGVLGIKTPGIVVFYPLSSQRCVMLIDNVAYKIKGLRNQILKIRNLSDVASINKLQIHNASNAVYFSDFKYGKYVEELLRQEKRNLIDFTGRVVEGIEVDEHGEEVGEIIHSFDQQLPFMPKLSFLNYYEVQENEYQIRSREEYVK